MRSIGLNPTNNEIREMINELDTDLHLPEDLLKIHSDSMDEKRKIKNIIDFPEFLAFLSRKSLDDHNLDACFNKLRGKDSKITINSLLKLLEEIGEPVNEGEYREKVENLFKEALFSYEYEKDEENENKSEEEKKEEEKKILKNIGIDLDGNFFLIKQLFIFSKINNNFSRF